MTNHLNSLQLHLSNERIRLAEAKTDNERDLRSVWVSQIEKEIEGEYAFLGKTENLIDANISDDELLAELLG